MKTHSLISVTLLLASLLSGTGAVSAAQQRSFGYVGNVDSFDRGKQMLVVDDRVFWITGDALVHKTRGHAATLSDIRPGVKVGFYPENGGTSRQKTYIDEIWILPSGWRGGPGHAGGPSGLVPTREH